MANNHLQIVLVHMRTPEGVDVEPLTIFEPMGSCSREHYLAALLRATPYSSVVSAVVAAYFQEWFVDVVDVTAMF